MAWDELDMEAKQRLEAFYQKRGICFEVREILGPWIESGIITTDLIPGSCEDHDQRIRWLHLQFIQELDRITEELEDSEWFDDSIELRGERCQLFDTAPQVWYQNLKDCLLEEEMTYNEMEQKKQEQKRTVAQRLHHEQQPGMDRNGKLKNVIGHEKQADTVGNVNQTEVVAACQQNRCKEPKNRNPRRFLTKCRQFCGKFV